MIEAQCKLREDYIEIFALAFALQAFDRMEDYVLVEDRQQTKTLYYFMRKDDAKNL